MEKDKIYLRAVRDTYHCCNMKGYNKTKRCIKKNTIVWSYNVRSGLSDYHPFNGKYNSNYPKTDFEVIAPILATQNNLKVGSKVIRSDDFTYVDSINQLSDTEIGVVKTLKDDGVFVTIGFGNGKRNNNSYRYRELYLAEYPSSELVEYNDPITYDDISVGDTFINSRGNLNTIKHKNRFEFNCTTPTDTTYVISKTMLIEMLNHGVYTNFKSNNKNQKDGKIKVSTTSCTSCIKQITQDKLQRDILETELQLSVHKQQLLALKSAGTLSSSSIIGTQDVIKGTQYVIKGYKAGLKALKALEKELF